jgi:serine protease AprX
VIFFKNKFDPIVKLKLKEKLGRTIPVIIMFKEPLSSGLKNSISKNRGKIKYEYGFMNAAAAEITLETADRLSERPEVTFISYDRKAAVCMDRSAGYVGIDRSGPYPLTGRNINIAVIDTGVYPHSDLMRPYRAVIMFKDYVSSCPEPYDDNGHGTFMCGIMAGSGVISENRYTGVAPGSKLIMLKAFNSVGEGSFSDIIAAIGWVIENREKYKIRILCLPFGAEAIVPHLTDPLCIACEKAWKEGLIVIAAAGNKGPDPDSITTPGISPSVITAGCSDCRGGSIRDWKIPGFSGRGSRKGDDVKPDILAPGAGIVSLQADIIFKSGSGRRGFIPEQTLPPYTSMSGTSASAAIAAGCAAVFLEKMPGVSNSDFKGMLKLSCRSLNELKYIQGQGVIDMRKLLDK